MISHNQSEILRQLLELFSAEGVAVVAVIVVLATLIAGLEQLAGHWFSRVRQRAPSTAGSIDSPMRTYQLLDEQAGGDVCDVLLATSGNTMYVLKVPRHANASDLLVKERDVLHALVDRGCPAHYRWYLPDLVESFRWGLRRVMGETTSGNITMIRIFRKLGFAVEMSDDPQIVLARLALAAH